MGHGGDIYRNKVKLDLSVNLNPLGMPEEIAGAIRRSIERAGVYPDLIQEDIRAAIAAASGISPDHVWAGCGASELILGSIRAIAPKEALLFEPCFSGYRHALDAAGCHVTSRILSEESGFCITEEDVKAIGEDTDIVFVCDPANPSGVNMDDGVLAALLDRAGRFGAAVILDESFYLLSDKAYPNPQRRSRELLSKYGNLCIIRSLTKILAVPGIRAGYVMSSPENIRLIAAQLPEWNLHVVSEEVIRTGIGIAADRDFISRTHSVICEERARFENELGGRGYRVISGNTSYILFKGPEDLYERLLAVGILIRDCSDLCGLEKGWYRIAVKSREENDRFIQTLREIEDED